jgi:hypothetical protein
MNPFVFIVGCPRSGTTLLQRVVNAHSQVAIINQLQWLPNVYKRIRRRSREGEITADLLPQVFQRAEPFQKLGLGHEEVANLLRTRPPMPYPRFVSMLFDLYGQARGKTLVGDKTPIYVRSIETLHALWPEARFVHLIRDGRDVCLSTINWKKKTAKLTRSFATWSEDAVMTAAMRWRWNAQLGREGGRPLGPRLYYEMQYESLVSRPAQECDRLCDFLGVPYDGAMLRFHEGRTQDDPNLDAKKAWRPITPGLRDWNSQMDVRDIARFEAVAGSLLRQMGYECVTEPGLETRKHAIEIEERFIVDLRARHKAVPLGW